MTPAAVTATLLHDLVTGSHAEGITALGVETVIEHNDAVLLVAEPGPDFDDTWQLPGGPVLPGQTLTDALHPAAAAIGLTIDEVTGYLGHYDHPGAQTTTRVFRFAVTVTDPGAICRHAGTGHRWAEDLDCPPTGAARLPATINTPAATDPPLADQLRAWARGIYPDEAGVELLIGHASFLHRADFTSRFITTPASSDGTPLAVIDWPAVIAALDGSLPLLRRREQDAPPGGQPGCRHTREPPRRPHRHRRPRHSAGGPGSPARFRTPAVIGIS